jgi:ketosteroid isomerase-like protein
MSRHVIDSYFDAVNNERWPDLATLLDDDATYSTMGARPRTGKSNVLEFFGTLFQPWREHDDAPTFFIIGEDAAAVDVHFTGVSRAGQPIEFPAVDIFRFRSGKIHALKTWYDLGAVRRMLEEKAS